MKALLAALAMTATLALGHTAAAAPAPFIIPHQNIGDTWTITTSTGSSNVVHVRCDGQTGSSEVDTPIVDRSATIGPFTFAAVCTATVGRFKGNGTFTTVDSAIFVVS